MNVIMQQKLDSYLALLDEIKERTGDDDTARVLLGEMTKDLRMEQIQQERTPLEQATVEQLKVAAFDYDQKMKGLQNIYQSIMQELQKRAEAEAGA